MRKSKKTVKNAKKPFVLSEMANNLIEKLHQTIIREVTKFDKKSQKGKI